jgi:hypothetical protein
MEYSDHRQKSHFNGYKENHEVPLAITSIYIIENVEKGMQFIDSGGICGSKNDSFNDSGVKQLCIFYKL